MSLATLLGMAGSGQIASPIVVVRGQLALRQLRGTLEADAAVILQVNENGSVECVKHRYGNHFAAPLTDAELGRLIREALCVQPVEPAPWAGAVDAKGSVACTEAIELINHERAREICEEGYDAAHDDGHTRGELVLAAMCYIEVAEAQVQGLAVSTTVPEQWPWDEQWWKPSADPMRNFAKGAGLLASEMDRVLRMRRKGKVDGVDKVDQVDDAPGRVLDPGDVNPRPVAPAETRVDKSRTFVVEAGGLTLQVQVWAENQAELDEYPGDHTCLEAFHRLANAGGREVTKGVKS